MIGVDPSADPPRVHPLGQHLRDLAQQHVSGRDAGNIVDQLKIFNIGVEEIIGPVRVQDQDFHHPLIEEGFRVKAGQLVVLGQAQHCGGLPKLDLAGHAVQNHLGIVGLGHKIRRAVGQSFHLVRHAVGLGGHDHRYGGKGGIRLDTA